MLLHTDLLKKAGIGDAEIQQLQTALNACQNAQRQTQHKIPHIVCTGIYNAGKSTLLNALIGEEKFPTGDIPTTKTLAQAESGGAVYVDTPGLNAAAEDDHETQTAYASADFILFVSSAQNGGISQAEAVWLSGLRDRYTTDGLEKRLVFVLTHCTQVDPEQLPEIRDKVRGDLEKAVGIAVEPIHCVDSVTYQKGRTEEKPLLVEHSGICELQNRIAEKVKEADALIAQAQAAEREIRRQEALAQIKQIRSFVQESDNKANQDLKKQITAVDKAWAEFEKELEETLPNKEKIGAIYCWIDMNFKSIREIKERSEYALKRKIEERIRPYYDKRERIVRRSVDEKMRGIREYLCSAGINSKYAICCNKINQVFAQSILALQKAGAEVSGIADISVIPELPSDLAKQITDALMDDVVDYGGFYTLSEYIDMYGSIYTTTQEERGFLGIYHDVEYYCFNSGGSIVNEMEKDMRKNLERNGAYAGNILNGYWQEFIGKLLAEVKTRKAALKQQVAAYKSTLTQSSSSSAYQSALSYLDELKKEVSR